MTDLIPTIERTASGALVVTSETIATGAGVEHRAVLQLIATHEAPLSELGGVAFEMRPFETPGGTQSKRIAMLNEQQATLVLALMRNTDAVVAFKVALVKAFFDMAQRLSSAPVHPELVTRADLARMVLESEEEKAVLSAALESAAPAIAYHDRFVSNDDAVTVKVWAAQHGLTDREAYALLVEKNVVYKTSIGKRWSSSKSAVVEEFEYRARAGRVSFAWFDLRPQHNAPRHHNGQVRQTLYVRQEHALDLGRKVGVTPVGQQGALTLGGAS